MRLARNPGAIGARDRRQAARLVLYTPAVSSIDCAGIAKGWQIAVFTGIAVRFRIVSGLVRLCHNSAVADGLRWSDCAGIWLAGRRTEG